MVNKHAEQVKASKSPMPVFNAAQKASPWVVVADGEVAKIWMQKNHRFDMIHEIHQPDLKTDGLDNDGRGRAGAPGAGRHAYEPSMEESRQGEMTLARMTAEWLEQSRVAGELQALVLIAAPQMLGELRKNLSKQVSGLLIAESNKQLTGHNGDMLKEELLKIIPGPNRAH